MRTLILNKFLHRNGGSETYIFKLGEALEQHGHEVQYFGMEHEGRCVGNRVNAYTSDMDFHGGSKLSKLTYPIKTIYSKEARVQLRKVLDDFKPDVCHLNNFNYQLTPSIILEIVKWRKETGRDLEMSAWKPIPIRKKWSMNTKSSIWRVGIAWSAGVWGIWQSMQLRNTTMNAMKTGVLRICRFSLSSGNCWYTIQRSRSSMSYANCSAARNLIMW